MKRVVIFVFLFLSFMISFNALDNSLLEDIYDEQFKLSGADKLTETLPHETLNSLEEVGIFSPDWKSILKLEPKKIINEILVIFRDKILFNFSYFKPILALILLCAMIMSMKETLKSKDIAKVVSSISILCLCSVVIFPIVRCINCASLVIKSAISFIFCLVPVAIGIMIASGNPIVATSYQTSIIFIGELISYLAGNFLVPFMNILLGISIITAISSNMDFEKLCNSIYKSLKFILKFIVTLFTGFITIQNLVSSSADNLNSDVFKFAINNCVPIVGSAMSDAFSTVRGCIQLLKSGVSAFGILAGLFIFLPIILECVSWILFLNFSSGLSDIFALKKISSLFKSISNVVSMVFAIILSVLVILIISTVILFVIGR